MRFMDRFLMLLYTLGVMAALFVIGLAAAGWTTPVNAFQRYLMNDTERSVIALVVIIYLIMSIRFFLQSLATEKRPVQAIVHETDMGQVRITAEALENLVIRVVNQVRGVREVKPRVVCTPEGINIYVRVTLSPETNIPKTSDEIQNNVTNYMDEVAGIKIKTVKLLVDGIASEAKPGTARKLM